jgi:hypothetical protein
MMRSWKIIAGVSFAAVVGAGVFVMARGSGGTTGQFFNATIDNLKAVGERILELPMFMLLPGAAVLAGVMALPLLRWGTKSGRITWSRAGAAVIAGVGLFALALLADRKISGLQAEIADLRAELNQERMVLPGPAVAPTTLPAVASVPAPVDPPATVRAATVPAATPLAAASAPATRPPAPVASAPAPSRDPATRPVKAAAPRNAYWIDVAKVQQNLAGSFGQVGLHAIIHDQATDFVEADIQRLPAIAYMAIVNLRTPGLEVKFGGSTTRKTLTSDFARANNCQIAINGEAGASPRANSGFGVWYGNWISAGKVVMKEGVSNKRPFLSFDRQSNPVFTAMAALDRSIGPDKFNVIWGRWDAIIDGRIQTQNERDRQPRTAMGISKEGDKLYLMVVDGRQPRYSIGFTRAEVGAFLQAFGASNGMLCDEGGSSCIYVKKFNRVVNSPSDGEERVTYTHFGISLTPQ